MDVSAPKRKRRAPNGVLTSPETTAARIRAAKALELRMEGIGFKEIAKEVGYNSPQAAHDAVKRALDRVTREPAEDLIKLDLERLDKLWQVQYLNALTGDLAALAGCMRLMERRAKLLGLDAPVRSEIAGKDGGPIKSEVIQVPADPVEAAAQYQRIMQDG